LIGKAPKCPFSDPVDLGCIDYRFYQEGKNENNIILILEWQTQEKLEACQNSEQYKILMGAISLLCESSEMKIGMVTMEIPPLYLYPLLSLRTHKPIVKHWRPSSAPFSTSQ
jgi:hypothetical protein